MERGPFLAISLSVSSEGRVEHQKRNSHVIKHNGMEGGAFRAIHSSLHQMEYFLIDMSNRVEHQKRNQPALEK